MPPTVRLATIGMGGFAAAHHQAALALEETGEARLIATCDPAPEAFGEQTRKWRFAERQVQVYTDYRQMLDAHQAELDVVTIPTPIRLHAPMHEECCRRGLAVYLEKPPTLDFRELEAMIDTDAPGQFATQVGFNFIIEEPRQELKRRLLAGEFGALREVSLFGLWPRGTDYYRRNDWAGRLRVGDSIVLDSCLGNAISHQVHNCLFWCGEEQDAFDEPRRVVAELYRAHPIQGADTFFVQAAMRAGVMLRVAVSHACRGAMAHGERVVCEQATIDYVVGQGWRLTRADGTVEEGPIGDRHGVTANLREYFRYLRGERPQPATRLADCRGVVHLNDLAYVAAGKIVDLSPLAPPDDDGMREIPGLREATEVFRQTGRFPSQQGCEWATSAAREAGPGDLVRFADTITRLAEAAPTSE